MSLGPLMIDIDGIELSAEDREVLRHPLVGGVILFTRNFESIEQLAALVRDIHALRTPRLIVAVDHEGGRVQRFRQGFTVLPPAAAYGRLYDEDRQAGLAAAEQGGWLMAAECLALGIDISFAPILDLDHGVSSIIGDRAFHRSIDGVAQLAGAWMRGMKRAGMAATGKHFPGHGGIAADSHLELPVDERDYVTLRQRDMVPFERLIRNRLAAIMMAHVVYPAVDSLPASFSPRWIRSELRQSLDFQGAVFCDDLTMEGAVVIGDYTARARQALEAGCDMLPVCNRREGVIEILDRLVEHDDPASQLRLVRLHGRADYTLEALQARPEWREAHDVVARLDNAPGLDLG
ncbi:MAG TPA: beta-N-acetylhexosaminidase [Gammaproteobacteria bacterium]|nr:beta-N-acetylhexosaminidase [Gammaproteobacteria bacterium]